jgi:hypothetical protein
MALKWILMVTITETKLIEKYPLFMRMFHVVTKNICGGVKFGRAKIVSLPIVRLPLITPPL